MRGHVRVTRRFVQNRTLSDQGLEQRLDLPRSRRSRRSDRCAPSRAGRRGRGGRWVVDALAVKVMTRPVEIDGVPEDDGG